MASEAERRIRVALAERGWSVAQLARELGTSRQSCYSIIRGDANRPTARYAVAAALGLRVEDIWPSE